MKIDAAYARQSLLKRDSLSISGQIALCQKSAGKTNLAVYKDAGYSGKNTDRPDFQRLLKDIKSGKIGKLYVYRLDRFSRSVADFGQLWDILQKNNVEFVSVSENFDTSTPMGRAMLHIIMVFAQLERETTAERVRDNYYRRAALGLWPGGPAPFGYDNGRIPGNGRPVPTIIPNASAEIVKRIYVEYASEGCTLGTLARKLTLEGIPAPQRDTWDTVTLSRILHNPTYVCSDEQVRLHFLSLGAQITSDPADFDGIHSVLFVGKRSSNTRKYSKYENHYVSVMNCKGIISSALWLKCQNKLAMNTQIANSGKGTHTWLSGLLKCARCGYSLKVTRYRETRHLACSGKYNAFHCDTPPIKTSLDEIEAVAAEEIKRILSECPKEQSEVQEDATFAKKLANIDRKADRLMDAFAESPDLPTSYLKRSLEHLEQQRSALVEAQKREVKKLSMPEVIDFDRLSFAEKKAVAAQLIRRIDVCEDSATFTWNV